MEVIDWSMSNTNWLIILVNLYFNEDRIYSEVLNAMQILLIDFIFKDVQALVLQQ